MISVVLPVYNTEKYLSKAVESVLNQTYDSIEVVLVNDGSTDSSSVICEYYSKHFSNISYYSIDNLGVAGARNFGIEHARGDYIGFVDSDDYIELDMYEKLYKAITENNADIALCGYDKISSNGELLLKLQHFKNYPTRIIDDYITNMVYILAYGSDMLPNKLFKKSIFEHIKLPTGKTYEDIISIPPIFEQASRVVYINDILYHYTLRSNNITSYTDSDSILAFLQAKRMRYDYVKDKNKVLENIAAISLLNSVAEWIDLFKGDNSESFTKLISDMSSYISCTNPTTAKIIKSIFNYY